MQTYYGYCYRVKGCSAYFRHCMNDSGKSHCDFHLLVFLPVFRKADRLRGQVIRFSGFPHIKAGRAIMVPAKIETVDVQELCSR